MSPDTAFAALIYLTLPAAIAYPIVYGASTHWWRDWIGRALFIKATGVAILIGVSAAFHHLGPDYPLRDTFRLVGAALVCVGVNLALVALLRALFQRRPPQS